MWGELLVGMIQQQRLLYATSIIVSMKFHVSLYILEMVLELNEDDIALL